MMAVDSPIVADDGARLWVSDDGISDGVPVICCHGGPGVADYLAPVAAMISDMARVIRWDQRGSGRSSPTGPYRTSRFVADIDNIRAGANIQQCVLLGHSWGANLAVHYAHVHPSRVLGIIYLCGTGLRWQDFTATHKRNQAARLGPELGRRLAELHNRTRTPAEDDEHDLLYLRTDVAPSDRDGDLARAMLAQFQRWPRSTASNTEINNELTRLAPRELERQSASIAAPVLIVHGEHDPRPAAAVDSLAAALPNVTRHTIQHAGHVPWLEQPDELRELLRQFLQHNIRTSTAARHE